LNGRRLPSQLETVCFRFVQQAFTNVARYACADHCWIVMDADNDSIRVLIQDDGIGFEPDMA
jgi:signal transduction histidine kinase